jgi:predicted lipid carrier protein YhbT
MASSPPLPIEDVTFMATGNDLLLITAGKKGPDTLFFNVD